MLAIRKTTAVAALSLGLAMGPAACRKAEKPGVRAIRLMDRVVISGVKRSPLAELADADLQRFVPVESRPLLRLGADENPFSVKKKIDLGIVEIEILFAPPRSEYVVDARVPAGGVLVFGTGIVRDRAFEELDEPFPAAAKGVEFSVRIEAGGARKTIFQKLVRMPPLREERTLEFALHRVPLPEVEGDVRLTLMTLGEGRAFAFWHNPAIYAPPRKARRVILISLDTLRADHLGAYGYDRPTSPNMDALAADGVLFERTYSTSNWTLPAHVSMLTGLESLSHGVYCPDDRMDASLVTLAERLAQDGFFTAGMTGGGYVSGRFGFSRGFDTYSEGDGSKDHVDSAELVCRAASKWLDDHKDRDFFLFLHTFQTHDPYDSPAPYNTMFLEPDARLRRLRLLAAVGGKAGVFKDLPEPERRNIVGLYDGEIRYADEALVGPLIAQLKALGLYDETMIVLTSDHGEEFYEHGAWLHGPHLYDETIRIPLIVKFPGQRHKGRRLEGAVRITDIMPTVLEAMGVETGGPAIDGAGLLPVIRGRERGDRTWQADSDWIFVKGCEVDGMPGRSTVLPMSVARNEGRLKLILNRELRPREAGYYDPLPGARPAAELYDLDDDSAERTNLTALKADAANRIARLIRDLYAGGPKRKPDKAVLGNDLEEQLRTLGYIK